MDKTYYFGTLHCVRNMGCCHSAREQHDYISNGNIAKSVVSGAIWFSLGLVVASVLAPTFTQVAVDAGFQLAQEGVYIISFGIMCHPLIAGLFYAFWSQNPIIIGAVVIAYFVLYFLFKKNKERFVGYLENAAAAYSAY